ncbi:MAG TPA: hypothetical protein VKY51_09235 [Fredinandcohnia sp.]|nr:hypothetical protein [Fredinandcohnia sp.]
MRHVLTTVLVALVLGPAGTAGAEEVETVREPDREIVRSQTRVDFDGSEVDGELHRPDGGYIPGIAPFRFRNLIELRRDFTEELRTSADKDL